jgi:serine/threonine protein kinase
VADFKTALEALGQNKIGVDALVRQLDVLLKNSPQHAKKLLAQLEEIYEAKGLEVRDYASLKGRINEFRRMHAAETEDGTQPSSEATVFDQGGNFQAMTATAGDEEEATEIREKAGARSNIDSEESTEVRARGGSGGDSTQVLTDDERPTGGSVDIDLSSPSADASLPSSIPPSTGPTGTNWQQPMSSEAAIAEEMGPGSVIKDRFKLLDVLGIGGMGKVYKGIDLLKQEARDKNPYMAIKLLNEDFKSHPEAFIALQRESSRQQKLAHPNIATVYDFDRIGGPGTPVFITMELMEGLPLNTYIKKTVRKQGGLPFPEAFNIVRQLGAALQYAHERRLVHSDFKPGNAFLCNDGTVKTLDFGIARAVKNPITGEGEKTLFDPGKLGALTPAYASLEMLEGEEPDPRDDIYALGCVAYELLTGKHPFNKLPATTARENGLVPAPIKGLNKKQNRALRRALAFRREDRSPAVEHFIEEFEGKANWHKNPFVIAAAVLLVIGIGMIPTIRGWMHQRAIDAVIAEIRTGDRQTMVAKLQEVRGMARADQTKIMEEAREPIQNYLSAEVARHVDIAGDNYSFPSADNALRDIRELYPDSLFLQQQEREVEFNRRQKLADLYNEYIAALDPEAALQNPALLDRTNDILATIRKRIDPNHPLLTDPRPANAYRLAAEQSFADGNYQQALSFITSGLRIAPDEVRLTDLQGKVQQAVRVAELRDVLGAAQVAALPDFKSHEAEIIELSSLSTAEESPLLGTLADALKAEIDRELAAVLKEGTRAGAESLVAEYGTLLGALQLERQSTQLKLAHLAGDERRATVQQIVAADREVVEKRLASPALDDAAWESDLLSRVRELESMTPEDPTVEADLQRYREAIAGLYVERSGTLLRAGRFDAAETFVNRGERFAPEMAVLQEARTSVTDARAEFERQLRISGLKEQFQYMAEANRVAEAQEIFDQLKAELPEDDPFITRQAPARLAESYAELAQNRAENREFGSALQLAEAGLQLMPRHSLLIGLRDDYRVEVNITELTALFPAVRVLTTDDVLRISRQVNQVEQGAPTRYPDFRRQSESVLAERIRVLGQSDENLAAALAEAASTIFRDSAVLADLKDQFQLVPWPNRNLVDAAIGAGELTRARTLIEEAATGQYAGHPDVVEMQQALDAAVREAGEVYNNYLAARDAAGDDYQGLNQAKRLLLRAQAVWVDNADYGREEQEIDKLIAAAPNNPARRVIRRETVDVAAAAAVPSAAREEWRPVSSGRECAENLAGHGRRARAVCYDLIHPTWRGPLMVVVPAGGSFERPFAIGKHEISLSDWAKYCAITQRCKPETNKERLNDPLIGITLKQAQEYVAWLSERTGKTYRLPTPEEWQYAASDGDSLSPGSTIYREIRAQVNCRVTMGDTVLKGTGTANVQSGRPNNWGLMNVIGNVQEWVVDGSGSVLARGGAFNDSINNCEIATERQHGGNADERTGFRVLLEDAG